MTSIAGITYTNGFIVGNESDYKTMVFDGSDEITTDCSLPTLDDYSVIAILEHNGITSSEGIMTTISASSGRDGAIFYMNSADGSGFRTYQTNTLENNIQIGGALSNGAVYKYALTRNFSGTARTILYLNTSSSTSLTQTYPSNDVSINLGNYYADGTLGLNANVQFIYIFSPSLTDDELAYFDGALNSSHVYPFTETPTPEATNFTIDVYDQYNNNSLSNYNAYINNVQYNDGGTGTIVTNITQTPFPLYNVTIEKTNYFNKTYTDLNISDNLAGNIIGTNVTLRIVFNGTNRTANISNTTLIDLNNSLTFVSEDGYFNINPTPLENLFFNISCNRSVFENRTFNLTFEALDENEYIIYVEPTTNILTFKDATNSSAIVGATINVTYPNGVDELSLITNSTGQVEFSYVLNGDVAFGNYTFEFDKVGYNLITRTENLNSSNVPAEFTYNVARATLNINVYHRENATLMTGINVTLNMLGVFQTTTNNGSYTYQDLALIPQQYTIQGIAEGYGTEQVTFNFNNQDNLSVDLYLIELNNSNTGTLFVTVIDEYYFRQIEASVSLMEYSATENGFITTAECLTNTNGECVFNIELNTKTYIIKASKIINGQLFSASSGTAGEIIKTDQEVRRLILRTSEDFNTNSVDNLIFSVSETFVNNVSNIYVEFQTQDNLPSTICVDYYEVQGFSKTLLQNDCTTSNGGVANLGVSYSLNRSNQYEALIYNLVGTSQYLLAKYDYPSIESTSEVFGEEGLNPYLIVAIFIGLLALSLFAKNISLFFILSMFIVWLIKLIFPQYIETSFAVAITIVSLMGVYVSRKKIQEG